MLKSSGLGLIPYASLPAWGTAPDTEFMADDVATFSRKHTYEL